MKSKIYFLFLLLSANLCAQEIIENIKFLSPNEIIIDEENPVQLGLFNEIELGVNLLPNIENQISTSKCTSGINPFDENQIEIFATLSKDNSFEIIRTFYGFYIREFGLSANEQADRFNDLNTGFPFRIRFALEEVGNYELRIWSSFMGAEPIEKALIKIKSVESSNLGFLRFNDNYLVFSQQPDSIFFPIGEGITYHRCGNVSGNFDVLDGEHDDYCEHTLKDIIPLLDSLSNPNGKSPRSGGNFVRFMLNPFNFNIEWDACSLGHYSEYLYRAQDFESILELCSERGIYVLLTLFDHRSFMTEGKEEYKWANNPYHSISGVNDLKDFYTNPIAKELVDRKIKYILSRWGYNSTLVAIQISSEIDNHYPNNDGFGWTIREECNEWTVERIANAKLIAPLKLFSTSVSSFRAGRQLFEDEQFDFSSIHQYTNSINNSYHHSKTTEFYKNNFQLPYLQTEVGIGGVEPFGLRPYNSIHHNNMWSSSFSGAFGASVVYYFPTIHIKGKSFRHFMPIRHFFQGEKLFGLQSIATYCDEIDCRTVSWDVTPKVDPESYTLRGINVFDANGEESSHVESFALKGNDRILGWVHHKSYYHENLPTHLNESIKSIDPIEETVMEIGNLSCGDKYEINWWSTHPWYDSDGNQESPNNLSTADNNKGGIITKSSFRNIDGHFNRELEPVNKYGELCIPIPTLDTLNLSIGETEDWAPDYAFKIRKIGFNKELCPLEDIIFNCYPNPTKLAHLNVDYFTNEIGKLEIQLLDIYGRVVENKLLNIDNKMENISTIKFGVRGKSPGVYFVVLKINNKVFATKKVLFLN